MFERSKWRNFLLYLSIATIYWADSSWRSIYSYSLSSLLYSIAGFDLSSSSLYECGAFRKSLISFQDKFISSSRLFLERHSRMGLNPVALSSHQDKSSFFSFWFFSRNSTRETTAPSSNMALCKARNCKLLFWHSSSNRSVNTVLFILQFDNTRAFRW